MPFRNPNPDVDIPPLSVPDFMFGDVADFDLDRPALIDGVTGEVTDYRTLISRIDCLAGALASLSIGAGSVVGILSPNIPAFATVFHGILRSGATATPINALYTADDIGRQLADSKAVALFTIAAMLPQAKAAAEAVGISDDLVIVLDGADGHPSLQDLLAAGMSAPVIDIDPTTHLAVLPYSSGTTGHPKGVKLSHANLVANICQISPIMGMSSPDRVLGVLPFFHIYGMTVLLNATLHARAALVTMPRFDLPEFLRIISTHECTQLYIAPPIALALAKHPLIDEFDLSSVHSIVSGAAPLDEQLGTAVARRLGVRMRQGFGMSEMSPVSHAIPFHGDDISLSSVGPSVPNMECKLIDPVSGDELEYPVGDGVSEAGELCCKGPNVMMGYLNNDAATAEAIDADGYLHTGDLATVDADGNVTIVDRLKELIKYKGYQVAPAELEALLLTHPLIADAAVVGVLDGEGEEVPKAFVVKQPGVELADADVIAYVAERVSPHKKVRQVQFIDTVPKSAAGKILRKDLRTTV